MRLLGLVSSPSRRYRAGESLEDYCRACGFGHAMKLFDDFDQTSRKRHVGANTLFVMFDRLVRLASRGPSTTGVTAATLRLMSRVGDRTVEKLFLSDAALTG